MFLEVWTCCLDLGGDWLLLCVEGKKDILTEIKHLEKKTSITYQDIKWTNVWSQRRSYNKQTTCRTLLIRNMMFEHKCPQMHMASWHYNHIQMWSVWQRNLVDTTGARGEKESYQVSLTWGIQEATYRYGQDRWAAASVVEEAKTGSGCRRSVNPEKILAQPGKAAFYQHCV